MIKMTKVVERFLKYAKIETTSAEGSTTVPSTHTQLAFANILADELKEIGLKDVSVDENGYVMATIPKNTDNPFPTIGFIAHMDTSPEASGTNVSPVIHENYDGSNILLKELTISPDEFPALKKYIGDTIITADGTTLLGADDKAGIAEIITAAEYLIKTNAPHGDIKIGFTPDEEIGCGADHFDVAKFGADFAYTMDGGDMGELEYENFNAAKAVVTIKGKSVHTGYAKDIMINASHIVNDLLTLMPEDETPETTEGYEGFFHVTDITSNVSKATVGLIIRDFDMDTFNERCTYIRKCVDAINQIYGNIASVEITEQYLNMFDTFADKMHVIDLAKAAFEKAGITPSVKPIRGGTDGARLSFMGLPCPNIFAGGHNFHGPYEFVPVSAMEKAVEIIINICLMADSF